MEPLGGTGLRLVVGATMEVDVGFNGRLLEEVIDIGAAIHDARAIAHEFGPEFPVAPGGECAGGGEDVEIGVGGAVEAGGVERVRRRRIRRLQEGLYGVVQIVAQVEDAGSAEDVRWTLAVASPHGHGLD